MCFFCWTDGAEYWVGLPITASASNEVSRGTGWHAPSFGLCIMQYHFMHSVGTPRRCLRAHVGHTTPTTSRGQSTKTYMQRPRDASCGTCCVCCAALHDVSYKGKCGPYVETIASLLPFHLCHYYFIFRSRAGSTIRDRTQDASLSNLWA